MDKSTEKSANLLAEETKKIQSIFAEILNLQDVPEDADFFGLGGDSFDAIRVISRIDRVVKVVTLFENPTARSLATHILSSTPTGMFPRVVNLSADIATPSHSAFVGVPYGGGEATVYSKMFNSAPDVLCCGIDLDGYDPSNPRAFDDMLDVLSSAIIELGANQTVIYGHCAGAALAACVAAVLKDRVDCLSLVVAASHPTVDPDAAIDAMKTTSNADWAAYLRSLGGFGGLTDDEADAMLERGRSHHLIASEAFRRLEKAPAEVPTLLLLGDEDCATAERAKVASLWAERTQLIRTEIVKGGGHYFLRTHGPQLEGYVQSHLSSQHIGGTS